MRWILTALTVLVGCNTGNNNSECSTESYWTGGNSESPLMHPGDDCIECHSSGEGPEFQIAGTVMGDYTDTVDCNGVEGVTVRITDGDGTPHEMVTNAAGNFYTNETWPTPLSVELEFEGRTSHMVSSPASNDCMSCHTETGENAAPGRIVSP